MGGGLFQLVAYGAQDVYLTGHPHITFFKTVYKRQDPMFATNYNVFRIMSGMGGLAYNDGGGGGGRVRDETPTQTIDLSQYQYTFHSERDTKESKIDLSQYEYKFG
jgi:hypothetical protein